MILMALRTEGNHPYSWMKKRRSPFVNCTRPRTLRCSTINCRLSAAFSASSRLLDLKSDATRFKKRIISVTLVANVRRFCQQINTDEIFGTHRSSSPQAVASMIIPGPSVSCA